ncbi:conserved Plasmodium protein, unknown function [Plasmodium relictum]|uniref:Uncharacterized protein n=1 Tax=Plasmodium relictum TaxID=85471 RepID=A0A1J1H7U1_PLARL|nr:conserved Plasmodium protein, unknown function [Plasmodium relictum]CRH00621.1 conserved Plasmodium protein, unknown function [Plasmodium relictum]
MENSISESSSSSNDIMLYNVLYAGGEKSQKTLIEMKEVQEENSMVMNNEIKEYEVVNDLVHEKIESLPEVTENLSDSINNILNIDKNVSILKNNKSEDNNNVNDSNNYNSKYEDTQHNNSDYKNSADYNKFTNDNNSLNFNKNRDDNHNINSDIGTNNKSNICNIINTNENVNNIENNELLSLNKYTSECIDNSLTNSTKIKGILSNSAKDEVNFYKNISLNSLYNINSSKINISLLKSKIEKQRLALSDMNQYIVTEKLNNDNTNLRNLSYSEGTILKNHDNYLYNKLYEEDKKYSKNKSFLEKKLVVHSYQNEKYKYLYTEKNENFDNKKKDPHNILSRDIEQDINYDKNKLSDDLFLKLSNNNYKSIIINEETNENASFSNNNNINTNILPLNISQEKKEDNKLKELAGYSEVIDLLNDLESSTKSLKHKFLIDSENFNELKNGISINEYNIINNKNKVYNEINKVDEEYANHKNVTKKEFCENSESNIENDKNKELKENIYYSSNYITHALVSDSESKESKGLSNEHSYKNDILLEKHICDMLNNNYLEYINFKETKKYSNIVKNFRDTTEITLRFSKIDIGKNFQDKLESYEKFYICYCIPVISKIQLNNNDIFKQRSRSLNSSYLNKNKSLANFSLRNKTTISKMEFNDKGIINKNRKMLTKKVFENKYKNKNISKYRNLTERKKTSDIVKENIIYDSFSVESKYINKNYVEFLEDVYHKVHNSILNKNTNISFLLCANLNKKKRKKIDDSVSCILQQKNLNILKLLNLPFVVPKNSEVIGFSEIPFIPTANLKIPIKELIIPNNCFTDFIKGPYVLFYLHLGIFEKTIKKENEIEIVNKKEESGKSLLYNKEDDINIKRHVNSKYDCDINHTEKIGINDIEKNGENRDLIEKHELKITSDDKINYLDEKDQNLGNSEIYYLKEKESNIKLNDDINETKGLSDSLKKAEIINNNLKDEKIDNVGFNEIHKSITDNNEVEESKKNKKENDIKKLTENNFESDYEEELAKGFDESKKYKKDIKNESCSSYIKDKIQIITDENDKNEVLYIYIDKIVNLSKKTFANLLICVRFCKDEKYTYSNFNLKDEKMLDILLNSNKKLCDMQEMFIEVWNYEGGKEEDCIGILKINAKEINENKNIMYLEKYFELTFRFYEDINFMFRIILIRGSKNMYENIKEFCKEYIENNETDVRKFLLNEDTKTNSRFNSTIFEDKLNKSSSFLSINEQYFIYDSANIYDNEYYIYEIQREILKKDIRSSTIVNNIVNKEKYKINIKNNNNRIYNELNGKFKNSINKNNENNKFSNSCDIMIHSGDTNDQYIELLKGINGEIIKNENKIMYVEIESIKEELLICGMNEHTVKLLISDLKNNSIKNKYVLKSYFEEYIDKIYNKWDNLSNKLFIKNKKNMLINDICEYLDNLYLDDDNYLNKEDFFLFFQDVGIVFVDSTVFDELCLLFYDQKKEKIHFSLFASLIIKKGVEELKNMVYGYDVLLKFFEFLYINNITIEYLENELFKIILQRKNYYSEKIRQNISTDILINSNIDCKKPNENLKFFLKEEDNICSCTSLIFLHSIQFILKKFNNSDFTAYDLFFLVKYIIQNQYNYVDSEMYVFVNVIKGIETVNITFFLCLYYIYMNQNNNNNNNHISSNNNRVSVEKFENEKKNSFNSRVFSNDDKNENNSINENTFTNKNSIHKDDKNIYCNNNLYKSKKKKKKENEINRVLHNSENDKEMDFSIQKNFHNSISHLSDDSLYSIEKNKITYSTINNDKENYKYRKNFEKNKEGSSNFYNLNRPNKDNSKFSKKKEKLTISMLKNNECDNKSCITDSNDDSLLQLEHSVNEENGLVKSGNIYKNEKKNKNNYNIISNNFNESNNECISIDKKDNHYEIESSMNNSISSCINDKEYENNINYSNKKNVSDISSKSNKNKNLNYETNVISAYNSNNKKRILIYRKDIKKAVKNSLVILYNRIVSGLINIEYISECLYNYYKVKNMFGSKNKKEIKKKKTGLLRLFDRIGLYTSHNIAKSILKWYKNEIYMNNKENKNSYLSINCFSSFNIIEKRKILNNTINYHINNINRIINKYSLNEEISGNMFSGSVLEHFFILLKERNININTFSKKNIFTYDDFYVEIENLNINFSKNYMRLLFSNLLTYDLTSFNSLNNKLIFFDSLESYWLNWNKLNFEFFSSKMEINNNTENILNRIKDKRRKLATYNKEYEKNSINKINYFSYNDLLVLDNKHSTINKWRSNSVKNIKCYNFFLLPLYSLFFYFSEEELLEGGKLIKYFFLNIFNYEINSLNINDYINKYYSFYDFLQISKDMIFYEYDHNDNDLFREDFLKLIILINNVYLKKKFDTTFKLQNFIQKKTHLFSKNFKNNFNIITRDIISFEKDIVNISKSIYDIYQSIETRNNIILNEEANIINKDELILNFFRKNRYIIKYIREYFYLYVFLNKIMNNKNSNLCFYEKESIIYQKKLKEYHLQKMRNIQDKFDNLENKHMYVGFQSNWRNKLNYFPFLYQEVHICSKEKKYSSKEYIHFVYPYLLLLCDFLKRIIHIYKHEYERCINKLFNLDYQKISNRTFFLYNVENIMARSGSFDSKEWNKIYSFFEIFDIKMSNFFLSLWRILKDNNYILSNKNESIIFNDKSSIWNLISNEGTEKRKMFLRTEDRKEIFIKNFKYYIAFDKVILYDLNEFNQKYMHSYIINDNIFISYMSCLYMRILFNECISTGLNINRLFQNMKTKSSFVNVLSKNFSHIFSHLDIDLFVKKYSFLVDMPSLHLSSYQNFISSSNFIKDLYKQGDFYNDYLRNKLFHFFLNNQNIFMKNYEKVENHHLISCDNLKSILSENGIFLSWAELYDFFQPLNKFCVIYDYKKYQFNKAGKPTPYILKAYINFSNLIMIVEKKYKSNMQKGNDNETQDVYKNEIQNEYKNEIRNKYNNDNNIQFEYNNKIQKKISDIKKAVSKNTWNMSSTNNNNIIKEKKKYINEELNEIKYTKTNKDIYKKDSENIDESYSKYNNLLMLSRNKKKREIILRNNEMSINKEKVTKLKKSICTENCIDHSNKKEEKKNIISRNFSKFSNVNCKLYKTSNGLYYNFSFNNLILENILFFLFLKMSNLMIKQKLKYKQIYFGIKNIREQHIKKKEIENACYFLLNIEKKELNNIIPDDFILYEKDLKNGIYLNIFILKKELQNMFTKFNSPVISIFDFINFFEKKMEQIKFSNYMFTYNFAYEWINYMNIKDEYINKESCRNLLNIFYLENFDQDDNYKENEIIKEKFKIKNEFYEENELHKEIFKNSNAINENEVAQCNNIRNRVENSNSEKNTKENNSNNELITNEQKEQKEDKLYNIIFKEKMIKIFEKHIKGKWKKILLPIFDLKTFYLHDIKILLEEFTGIKKLLWKTKENNQNRNDEKEEGKFSLSYFSCFGANEILIDDILNSERQDLKSDNNKFSDTVHVNYVFEHKFSTIKEKDLISLFEKNKEILNLKLYYNQKKIAEANLHILEFFSVIKSKEKKDHKILCFVSSDDEYREILFLDIDIYYEREKLFSNIPVFETTYKKVNENSKIESYDSNKNNIKISNLNNIIKEKLNHNTKEKSLIMKNVEKQSFKNVSCSNDNYVNKDDNNSKSIYGNERWKENISISEYALEKKEIIPKKNKNDDYILVEDEFFVNNKKCNEKYNDENINSLVSMHGCEYNNKINDDAEESFVPSSCKVESKYYLKDEKRNNKHELEIKSVISNEKKREDNKDSNFVSYVNLTVDRIILPFYLLKDLNNKFSEVKKTDKSEEEIFIAFYIEIYQKIDDEEKEKYELLSSSVPRIVNHNDFVSNDNLHKNDISSISYANYNIKNRNNSCKNDTLKKNDEDNGNNDESKKDIINIDKDQKSSECNNVNDKTNKEEVKITLEKSKNNINNLDINNEKNVNNKESINKSLKIRNNKNKEKKLKLFDKYLNIYNLKIKHNEVIKSKNLYVEGKIIIRALISLNYNSEDLIIGEHFFKIKNMLYENKNITFCSENLLYTINSKYPFQGDHKDNKMHLNDAITEKNASNEFLMKENSINKSHWKVTEEEGENEEKKKKKSNNDTFYTINGNYNGVIKYINENEIINNIKEKKVIGYVSYKYQIKKNKNKNYEKRNKILIPNFIKIYFIKYDKYSLKNKNERNNALHNTIYEKIFSDVLRKVNYRKYVNVEMFIESLKNTNYSNDISYFKRFFHYFINSDNNLYFPLETILTILALRRLSFHFINSLSYFFDEIQKYFLDYNGLGIVEWAYLLKCLLKSQNKFIKTEKEKKTNRKNTEPYKQNNLYDNSNYSSTTSTYSLHSTSRNNSVFFCDKEKRKQKKNKIKRKMLNEKDWCFLNNWRKWHLYNDNKNYFFLYLFLNDIVIFYEEYKNYLKQKNDKISSLFHHNKKFIKDSSLLNEKSTNKINKLLDIKNTVTTSDDSEMNSFNNIKNHFQKSSINVENVVTNDNNNYIVNYRLHSQNKNVKNNLKDEKESNFFSRKIFDLKKKKNENDYSILNFYKNKDVHSYYMKKENDKSLSESTNNILYSGTLNSKSSDLIKSKYNNRTSVYQYNVLKNKKRDKYIRSKENFKRFFSLNKNIKNIKQNIINTKNNFLKKCNNLDTCKYKIYVKVKKILHPLPLINNKKPNTFLSFQIVLNNYDFLNKNDVFPFLINNKKNYIINRVQARSNIFFNECYPLLNISTMLKLPNYEELNNIFNVDMRSEDFNFYLKNLSIQICIYHVINNYFVDYNKNNNYQNSCIYYSSSSALETHKNFNMLNYTKEKEQKKTLIANTLIPLSALLNKNKTKIRAPLIFSPFFTTNNNKNYIEIILKYDNNSEITNKSFLENNYKCLLKKIDTKNSTSPEIVHHKNFLGIEDNKKKKSKILNDLHDVYTKNNLSNTEQEGKKEFIDFFNIPLLSLPKIPPPIS